MNKPIFIQFPILNTLCSKLQLMQPVSEQNALQNLHKLGSYYSLLCYNTTVWF